MPADLSRILLIECLLCIRMHMVVDQHDLVLAAAYVAA